MGRIPGRLILLAAFWAVCLTLGHLDRTAQNGPTLQWFTSTTVLFATLSLLGIWGALGTTPWGRRLVAVAFGVVLVSLWRTYLLGRGIRWDMQSSFFLTAIVVGALLPLRRWRGRIERVEPEIDVGRRFQFSIAQMLVVTFVAAVILSLLATFGVRAFRGFQLLGIFLFSVPATWAALMPGRPGWRVFAVLLIAVGYGAVFNVAFEARWFWDMIAVFGTMPVAYTLALLASLLVVRSCGYRLVRRTAS